MVIRNHEAEGNLAEPISQADTDSMPQNSEPEVHDTTAPVSVPSMTGPRATWQHNPEKPEAPGLLQITFKQSAAAVKPTPAALVFVLDNSGSMAGRPWRTVQSAMKYIETRRLEKDMTVKYVIYNSNARTVDGPAIQVIGVTGMTNFNAAFEETIKVVGDLAAQHKEIVISFLTDGQNTEGGDPLVGVTKLRNFLKEELRDVSSTVHSIGFGDSHALNLLGEILKAGTSEGCYRFADQSMQGGNLEEKFVDLFDFSTWSTQTKIDIGDGCGFQPVTAFVANGETKIQLWLHLKASSTAPSSVRLELLPGTTITVDTCPADELFRIFQLEQLVVEAQQQSELETIQKDLEAIDLSSVPTAFSEEAGSAFATTMFSSRAQMSLMKRVKLRGSTLGAPSVSITGQLQDLKSEPRMLRAQRYMRSNNGNT